MKAILSKSVLFTLVVITTAMGSMAQKVITGTVYREGKVAAGITVEAHKGSTMMTSFDGLYSVEVSEKSKYLKFTFIDETKKLDIEGNTKNKIDFYFDGIEPAGASTGSGGINLKSVNELIAEGDEKFKNEFSLYQEFFKQQDYKSAKKHWKFLYDNYPKSTLNLYHHGAKMNEDLITKAKTWKEKNKYIKDMMSIYDQRIKYFGQEGFVRGRKGTALLKYTREVEDISLEEQKEIYKTGYENLEQSVKELGEEAEMPVLVLLMQTTRSLFKMQELPKEKVIENYDLVSKLMAKYQEKNPDDEQIGQAIDAVERMFGTSGAADCEALINIFTPQYQENSENIDWIKRMLRRLGRANCDESDLFASATEKLYTLEPSAEAAFNMARRFVKKNDAEKAKEYYKQAMEQETDQELLENYYYEYGLFIFAKENALQEARNYARKALAINPKNCKALMLIGDIYTSASRSFGADAFEKATVFWVAVDYYVKSRQADEECYADAAKKAADYKKYFPDKETGFMNGLTEGEKYTVEGWINESTKVRYK